MARIPAIVLTLFVVLMFTQVSHAVGEAAARRNGVFCIRGTSDDIRWSWEIEEVEQSVLCDDRFAGPAPLGADADALAQKFVDSVKAKCEPAFATAIKLTTEQAKRNCTNVADPKAAFRISLAQGIEAKKGFILRVHEFENQQPNCDVTTTNTCNFNPEITRAPDPMPTLGQWGRLALVLLMLAAASAVILRRLYVRRGSTA